MDKIREENLEEIIYENSEENLEENLDENLEEFREENIGEDVDNMIQCLEFLGSMPDVNKDYGHIVHMMELYLKKYCQHDYITDYIDITSDYGCNITYCQKCSQTF